jgi:hypothetical protein
VSAGASAAGAPQVGTTYGEVDIRAGLLRERQFFPLKRQLLSGRHPQAHSQNAVEEVVLRQAVDVPGRVD